MLNISHETGLKRNSLIIMTLNGGNKLRILYFIHENDRLPSKHITNKDTYLCHSFYLIVKFLIVKIDSLSDPHKRVLFSMSMLFTDIELGMDNSLISILCFDASLANHAFV